MFSRQKLLKHWYTKMLHILFSLLCVKYIFFWFYRSIRFKAKEGVRTCKDYVIGREITTILKNSRAKHNSWIMWLAWLLCYNPGQNILGQLWKLRAKIPFKIKLWIDLLNKVDSVVLVHHFFCLPFPQVMLSLPKMTWMPDINITSGGGGGRKYVIFTGLLPLCPKSSGQDCRSLLVKKTD